MSEKPESLDAHAWRTAGYIGWWKIVIGVISSAFLAGGTAYGVAAKLATKAEVHAAIDGSTARLSELERWRTEHSAQHSADTGWIKESLRRLLDREGLKQPEESRHTGEPWPPTPTR